MTREMAFAICALEKSELTRTNRPDLAATRLVLDSAIQSYGQHPIRAPVPIDLAHARGDAGRVQLYSRPSSHSA